MHNFDYRFLGSSISADLSGASNILFDLRARNALRMQENAGMYEKLRQAAIIESVRGSNAIEGIVTTRARLEKIVLGDAKPITHGEQEILGYREALQELYSPDFSADLTEDYIRHLHRVLLQATSVQAGTYKSTNNWIQERDAEGHISVRFVPLSARETPYAMNQMVMAYHEASHSSSVNELALIACIVVDFLCIHPFDDGNGRVSRLLSTMLLLLHGFDIVRFVSMESMIDTHKSEYYDALQASSVGWHESENDYEPFILYFIQILSACYRELDQRYVNGSTQKLSKAKLVESLLMDAYVPISKEELCLRLPEVSKRTVERVLQDLMRQGRIEKVGTYRDARYRRV